MIDVIYKIIDTINEPIGGIYLYNLSGLDTTCQIIDAKSPLMQLTKLFTQLINLLMEFF